MWNYEGSVQALIVRAKAHPHSAARTFMEREFQSHVLRCGLEPGVFLAPPPSWKRTWKGFHLAGELAKSLRHFTSKAGSRWDSGGVHLVRKRRTPPQVSLAGDDRRLNLLGAFGVRGGHVPGTIPARVWLVDDVCTTGATLSACAVALKERGVSRVGALVVARAPRS